MLYYEKNDIGMGSSFLQQEPNETMYEPTFDKKDSRKLESKGIVQLLDTIIEDLQSEIAADMKAEEASQLDFENRLNATEALESELQNRKINLDGTIAAHNEDITSEGKLKDG